MACSVAHWVELRPPATVFTNGNWKATTSVANKTRKQAENAVFQVSKKLATGQHSGTLLERASASAQGKGPEAHGCVL